MVLSSVTSVYEIITTFADVTSAFVMQVWLSVYEKHGQVIKIIFKDGKITSPYFICLFFFDNYHKKCPNHMGIAGGNIVKWNCYILILSCILPMILNLLQ